MIINTMLSFLKNIGKNKTPEVPVKKNKSKEMRELEVLVDRLLADEKALLRHQKKIIQERMDINHEQSQLKSAIEHYERLLKKSINTRRNANALDAALKRKEVIETRKRVLIRQNRAIQARIDSDDMKLADFEEELQEALLELTKEEIHNSL